MRRTKQNIQQNTATQLFRITTHKCSLLYYNLQYHLRTLETIRWQYSIFCFTNGSMPNPTTRCKFCNEDFNSRNEMFRHLKSSRVCFNLANEGSEDNSRSFLKVEKQKVAIQFGYYTSKGSNRNINEDAADIVCSSFLEAMKYLYPSSLLEYDGNFSLASSVRSRHPVLAQEGECSAFSDVIGINYKCVDIKIDFEEVLKYVQITV